MAQSWKSPITAIISTRVWVSCGQFKFSFNFRSQVWRSSRFNTFNQFKFPECRSCEIPRPESSWFGIPKFRFPKLNIFVVLIHFYRMVVPPWIHVVLSNITWKFWQTCSVDSFVLINLRVDFEVSRLLEQKVKLPQHLGRKS